MGERALALDPDYANAWVLYGLTHYEDAMWGWSASRDTSISQGEEAANKAIELEEFSPDGFSLLASVETEKAEFEDAVNLARKAVSLAPKHAPNVALFAVALARAGEHQEALHHMERAVRLSPIYPAWYLHIIGSLNFALGEYAEAASAYRACVKATDPDSAFMPIAKVFLAVSLAATGHALEASNLRTELIKSDPKFSIEDWWQTPRKDFTVRERVVQIWNEIGSP